MNALRRSLLLAAGCGALAVLFSGCAAVMVGAASGTAGAVVASDSRTVNTMMYDETIEQEGNEVEIFGKQHPIDVMASCLDTIPYEILTSVSLRVKRVYIND